MLGLWTTLVRHVFSSSDVKNGKSLEYAVEEKPLVVKDRKERDIETLINIKEDVKQAVVETKYGTFKDVAEFHKDNKQTNQSINNQAKKPPSPTAVATTALIPVSSSVFPPGQDSAGSRLEVT